MFLTNVSLMNLAIAASLQGPYLSLGPLRTNPLLNVRGCQFTRLFQSLVYASTSVQLAVQASMFRTFLNSAISVHGLEFSCVHTEQYVPDTTNAVVVEDCIFSGCQGENGGAISFIGHQPLTTKRCSFYKCHANTAGGAIFAEGSNNQWTNNGLTIETCCFVDCYVTGTAGDGYAVHMFAVTWNLNDISFVDCALDGAEDGFVVSGRGNTVYSRQVNFSNAVPTVSVGALTVAYVGGSSASLNYHRVDGFKSHWVYDALLQAANAWFIFENADITNVAFSSADDCAVFSVRLDGAQNNRQLQVTNCNVYFITGTGKLWISETAYAKNSFTDREDFVTEGMTLRQEFVPNQFELANEAYCYYETEELGSDTEASLESGEGDLPGDSDSSFSDIASDKEDPDNNNSDKDGAPLSDGAIAGIVVAIVVIIVIVVVLLVLFVLRRRHVSSDSTTNGSPADHEMDSETVTTQTTIPTGVSCEPAPPPTHNLFDVDQMSDPFSRDMSEAME